jgi:hypothetical protein
MTTVVSAVKIQTYHHEAYHDCYQLMSQLKRMVKLTIPCREESTKSTPQKEEWFLFKQPRLVFRCDREEDDPKEQEDNTDV